MSLEELGAAVRDAQSTDLERRRRVRRRLLTARAPKKRILWWPPVLIAAAAALIAFWMRPAPALTFAVEGRPSSPETFVAAEAQPLALSFSDGSRIQLSEGSRAQVDELTPVGATLRIDHGTADVRVRHREETSWRVQAGPYTVHVVGTSFSVHWNAETGAFDVAMREGEVVVEGPEGFRTSLRNTESLHRERPVAPVEVAETIVEAPVAEEPPPVVEPPSVPRWRVLSERGEFRRASEALRSGELRRLSRRASAAELREVATLLRRGGDAREAEVWESIRSRFAGDPFATEAAFYLARRSFHGGRRADAKRWLQIYLAEAPRGRWEMEARGRLLEVLEGAEARGAAAIYLERFPEGPHASVARTLTP
ncbi:MAG: FecR family protein [Myxococcota bacterium]